MFIQHIYFFCTHLVTSSLAARTRADTGANGHTPRATPRTAWYPTTVSSGPALDCRCHAVPERNHPLGLGQVSTHPLRPPASDVFTHIRGL